MGSKVAVLDYTVLLYLGGGLEFRLQVALVLPLQWTRNAECSPSNHSSMASKAGNHSRPQSGGQKQQHSDMRSPKP